jgi:hypothetical protein
MAARDDYNARDQQIIDNADFFVATAFRGRGVYEKVECWTLDNAVIAGRALYDDRPVAIYAIWKGRQAHILNVNSPTETVMAKTILYVLAYSKDFSTLLIEPYTNREIAAAALEQVIAARGDTISASRLVESDEDLRQLPAEDVVGIFNKLCPEGDEDGAESPLTSFDDADKGCLRTWIQMKFSKNHTAPTYTAPDTTGDEQNGAPTGDQTEGTDTMATTKKTGAKKAAAPKVKKEPAPKVKKEPAPKKAAAPKVKKEPAPKKEKTGVDKFGLRLGSKNSVAAALFARAKGATMADVIEAVGSTKYNLLNQLIEAGHTVTKDGKTITLRAAG